jgi:hypothetical protein
MTYIGISSERGRNKLSNATFIAFLRWCILRSTTILKMWCDLLFGTWDIFSKYLSRQCCSAMHHCRNECNDDTTGKLIASSLWSNPNSWWLNRGEINPSRMDNSIPMRFSHTVFKTVMFCPWSMTIEMQRRYQWIPQSSYFMTQPSWKPQISWPDHFISYGLPKLWITFFEM